MRGPFPTLTKPLIGAVNGVAVTGGLEYALNCDFLVASEHAKFGDTHSRVGVMPGWGLTVLLPQAIGIRRAREMSFTGNFMLADEALAFGLVNHVVAHAELMPFTRQLALDIIGNDQPGVRQIRDDLRPDRHRRRPLGDRVTRQPGLASQQLQPRRRRRATRRDPSPRPAAVDDRGRVSTPSQRVGSRAGSDRGALGAEGVADRLGDVDGEDLGAGGVEVEAVVGADVLALAVAGIDHELGPVRRHARRTASTCR